MPTKLTGLSAITTPSASMVVYIVDPSLTTNGSKKIALNDLFATINKGITDKTIHLDGTTSPSASSTDTAALYYDTSTDALRISENGGSFIDVVLLTKSQVLTNKTLTQPAISNFTSATHDHHNAATGGAITDVPVTITDVPGGTISSVDAASGLNNFFRLTFTTDTDSRTMNGPSNPADAQVIIFEIKQSSTGSSTLTLATGAGNFIYGTDITSTTLTTAGSKTDYITAAYNLAANRWRVIGFVKGY